MTRLSLSERAVYIGSTYLHSMQGFLNLIVDASVQGVESDPKTLYSSKQNRQSRDA